MINLSSAQVNDLARRDNEMKQASSSGNATQHSEPSSRTSPLKVSRPLEWIYIRCPQ